MAANDPTVTIDRLRPADLPVAFGPFRLTGVLGIGGMARVFRAEDCNGRVIALKVLRDHRDGPKLARALEHEARLGSLLKHRNLVHTLAVGDVDGRAYLALEFVDGLTLKQMLDEAGAPPLEHAVEVGLQIARGLHVAHSAEGNGQPLGLVHRDLKPSNVMVDKDGAVKVMDFGIAKARQRAWVGTTTETGRVKGTPMYMSPEQARGLPLDRRSDLFSLGAILFELMTGKRLFVGSSIAAVLMRIMCVESLLERDRGFCRLRITHPDLARVIARCLRLDPTERYDDADQIAIDLERVSLDLPSDEPLRTVVRDLMDAGPIDERPTRRLERTKPSGGRVIRLQPADRPLSGATDTPTLVAPNSAPSTESTTHRVRCLDPFADPDLSFFADAEEGSLAGAVTPIRLEHRVLMSS